MSHRMILNETSYFGYGAIENAVPELNRRGFKKAFVVTDKPLLKFKVATKVLDLLDKDSFAYEVFDEVEPNPTIETVLKALAAFKASGADCIIAIGGGSPQDTAKAVGIIANNPEFEDVRSLEGVANTKNKAVFMIAIPTTAGTASEVTINYVVTDTQNKRKFVCVDPNDIPQVAIVDSQMMESMPASLKAATGVDALTHAIEGYITKGAWELSDALHIKAIELIAKNLKKSCDMDKAGGEGMALAQYVAGMGFSNVGLGLVHGMAHPLGAFYGIAHGVANAVLLPYVMKYNADYTQDKYRDIAKAMGVANTESMSIEQAREAAVNAVFALNEAVGIPKKLNTLGVKKEDIDDLAKAALADVCTGGNPRDVKIEDIVALYNEAF